MNLREARDGIHDAIKLCLESLASHGEEGEIEKEIKVEQIEATI
jgi:predicted RNase H-like HicB family nuclease